MRGGEDLADDAAGSDARTGAEDAVFDDAALAEGSALAGFGGAEDAVIDASALGDFPAAVGEDVALEQLGGGGGTAADHGVAELEGGAEVEELAGDLGGLEGDAAEGGPEFAPHGLEGGGGEVFVVAGVAGQCAGHVFVEIDLTGEAVLEAGARFLFGFGQTREKCEGLGGRGVEEEQAGVDEDLAGRVGCAGGVHGLDGYFLKRVGDASVAVGDKDAVRATEFGFDAHGECGDAFGWAGRRCGDRRGGRRRRRGRACRGRGVRGGRPG